MTFDAEKFAEKRGFKYGLELLSMNDMTDLIESAHAAGAQEERERGKALMEKARAVRDAFNRETEWKAIVELAAELDKEES